MTLDNLECSLRTISITYANRAVLWLND